MYFRNIETYKGSGDTLIQGGWRLSGEQKFKLFIHRFLLWHMQEYQHGCCEVELKNFVEISNFSIEGQKQVSTCQQSLSSATSPPFKLHSCSNKRQMTALLENLEAPHQSSVQKFQRGLSPHNFFHRGWSPSLPPPPFSAAPGNIYLWLICMPCLGCIINLLLIMWS